MASTNLLKNDKDYKGTSNIIHITDAQTNAFLDALGVSKTSYTGNDFFTHNKSFKLNDKVYKLENTGFDAHDASVDAYTYNLYDVIAMAKAAGVTNTDIAKALNKAGVYDHYDNGDTREWTDDTIKTMNINTTAASKQVQDYINTNYPGVDAYVSVILNKNGAGYTTRVFYKHPDMEDYQSFDLGDLGSDKLGKDTINEKLGASSEPGKVFSNLVKYNTQQQTLKENAQAQIDSNTAILEALGYSVDPETGVATLVNNNIGNSVNTSHNLTDAQIASLSTVLPNTVDLKAWTAGKDVNLYDVVYNNLKHDNADNAKELNASTNKVLSEIKGLSDIINAAQLDTTQRNINNQQQQLLSQIKKDPALYEAIVKQLRTDSAAETIAGQRAANAQRTAEEVDATYDKAATDLYTGLFTGENAVADKTRDETFSNSVSGLNTVQQGALSELAQTIRRKASDSTSDLQTFADSYSTALDVDASKYDDAIKIAQSLSADNASKIVTDIEAAVKKQIADNDGALSAIAGKLDITKDALQSALNGEADVTPTIQAVIDNLVSQAKVNGGNGGYVTVALPLSEEAVQFDNKHYDDFVNSGAIEHYFSDDTKNALTTEYTSIDQLLKEYGLTDILSQEGIKALYKGYSEEANKQSDKVFNAAQRAYIAAITAGDVKTADQLVKLATTASSSKSNLYATSAFANQLKQQFGLNNTGRQLATDYHNQQAANASATAKNTQSAIDAYTVLAGNGADSYDKTTLNAIINLWNNAALKNQGIYSSIANKHMNTTQTGLNTSNTNSVVADNNRKTDVSSAVTGLNVTGAVNNITNSYTKDTLATEALASLAQGIDTKKKLK